MDIHIGKLIQQQVKISALSNAEFARKIDKLPQNIKDVFGKKSIDTDLLSKISEVLDHNFFDYYTQSNGNVNKAITVNKSEDLANKKHPVTVSFDISDPIIKNILLGLIGTP